VESRPRTNRRPHAQTPTDTTPPPGGSADLAGHRPRSSKGLTLAAESPRRETITPLRGDRDETGRAMTKASERRAGTTRQRLIRRASREFAHHPYSMVSLDDVPAEAELTKGAMYFTPRLSNTGLGDHR
jgi:hypothetical protein